MRYGVLMYGGAAALALSALSIHNWVVLAVVVFGGVLFEIRARLAGFGLDARTGHRVAWLLLSVETLTSLVLLREWPAVGLALIMLGGACNYAVIFGNRGHMPVTRRTEHPLYTAMDSRTRLPWLADIFPSGRWTFSPGDVFIVIGVWVFAAELWLARF